jgi:hypothetical protein
LWEDLKKRRMRKKRLGRGSLIGQWWHPGDKQASTLITKKQFKSLSSQTFSCSRYSVVE